MDVTEISIASPNVKDFRNNMHPVSRKLQLRYRLEDFQ